jgi:two-component sensor histidine kinase
MVWDIGLTQVFNHSRLGQWRSRLLLSYLMVTGSVLGVFAFTVYGIVARDRQHQIDVDIHQLATVAAVSIDTIQHEYEELFSEAEFADYVANRGLTPFSFIPLSDLMEKYRASPSSSLNSLTPSNQGIEWFNHQKQPLVYQGDQFPSTVLPSEIDPAGEWFQQGELRSFVMPISAPVSTHETAIVGYVRATESLLPLTTELKRFRRQLALGVLLVSGLVTVGGIWLTQQALRPVLASFEHLKQFTSDASHELRNPLTAIRASIAVLQNHPERVHPSDLQKIRAIASASQQMSQLVDDLLLLARLDRQTYGSKTWRLIPLDELLEDLGDLYENYAAQADITLTVDDLTPVTIQADAEQLQRLFTNLLTNALKYTPAQDRSRLRSEPMVLML